MSACCVSWPRYNPKRRRTSSISGRADCHPGGRRSSKIYAVAIDIGTTTVACSLLDLETGEELGRAADINPQTRYGADVLSRIERAMRDPDGIDTLQALIVGCLDG
jgi:uncharacterized 2Fe-2S/4Fe-4S cluster protein (DUF4445 family)